MEKEYDLNSKIFKALSDSNRLRIVDMLSSGERCACEILECFNFTQPTLSHHMKVLMECGLISVRKEGTWSYYSLNTANTNRMVLFLMEIITDTNKE